MKNLMLILFCILHCALCIDLRAQDDAESIVSGDVEVEGLDNFWVESRLVIEDAARCVPTGLKPARPAGGNIAFLTHVQKYMSKVFNVLVEKYPEEMLNMMGLHTEVRLGFEVTTDGKVQLESITNGALLGFDVAVAEKLLKTYRRRWTPARCDGEAVESRMELVIDVSF